MLLRLYYGKHDIARDFFINAWGAMYKYSGPIYSSFKMHY